MDIDVFSNSPGRGTLRWGGKTYLCTLGRGGVSLNKREGDGATPVGAFPLRAVLYRPDRMARPATRLPCTALDTDDGWCDDPGDPAYNRAVKHPYPASAERLWREDGVYDLIVVLGYNDAPVTQGAGSAIFLHVGRADGGPTEGCVAVARDLLLSIIAAAGPETMLRVHSGMPSQSDGATSTSSTNRNTPRTA